MNLLEEKKFDTKKRVNTIAGYIAIMVLVIMILKTIKTMITIITIIQKC